VAHVTIDAGVEQSAAGADRLNSDRRRGGGRAVRCRRRPDAPLRGAEVEPILTAGRRWGIMEPAATS